MRSARIPKANPATAVAASAPMPQPTLHARWVKYLILSGETNEAIQTHLLNDDMVALNDAVLNAMRASLSLPSDFDPTSKAHRESAAFIRQCGLWPLFFEPMMRDNILRLLRTPRARELVEAAALIGVPHADVVATLARYLHMTDVTESLVEMFLFVFFDTSAVTRAQLKMLVHRHVRQAIQRVIDVDEDASTARRAVSSDARMVAVSMLSTPLAWSVVLMAAGYAPCKHEITKILDSLELVAITRAAEALLRGGPDDERRAEGFATVLRNLREIHDGAKSPDDELHKHLAQFRLKSSVTQRVTVADLRARGDLVTSDLVPSH